MEYIIAAVISILIVSLLILVIKNKKEVAEQNKQIIQQIEKMRADFDQSERALRTEVGESTQRSINSMLSLLIENQQQIGRELSRTMGEKQENAANSMQERQNNVASALREMQSAQEERFKTFATENEQKLNNIRNTVEQRLDNIRTDNNQKLEQMRVMVDEKLQKTINDRMTQSFQLVNERLEQVYKGLGEMQTLAAGVGNLSKVLSNVKTRGILGEVQLGAILEDVLTPEQYRRNYVTVRGSRNPVEYAIKLPSEDGEGVYMPVDSKFPLDIYTTLMDAYENGSVDEVRLATAALKARLRESAKEIRTKYISPPHTTEFAIMFLPTEGLYAEALKLGMSEQLQTEFRVSVAGPSTMAALLNSLQMGFRAVAIQKRSSEVWKVLGTVKTEFEKFSDVLRKAQDRLQKTNEELETLVGTRTRKIISSLKNVTALPEDTNVVSDYLE